MSDVFRVGDDYCPRDWMRVGGRVGKEKQKRHPRKASQVAYQAYIEALQAEYGAHWGDALHCVRPHRTQATREARATWRHALAQERLAARGKL